MKYINYINWFVLVVIIAGIIGLIMKQNDNSFPLNRQICKDLNTDVDAKLDCNKL